MMYTVRLFRHHVHSKLVVLALVELALLVAAVYGSAYWRLGGPVLASRDRNLLFWQAVLVASVVVLSMYALGLYHRHLRADRLRLALRIGISFASAAVLLAVLFYVFPSLYLGRGIMGLATVAAFASVLLTHLVVFPRLDKTSGRRRVLIYGAGYSAANILARLRRRSDWISFQLLGCIPVPNEKICIDESRILFSAGGLAEFASSQRVDEIIVAMDERRNAFPIDELLGCRLNGVVVTDMLGFYERCAGKIKTDLVRPSWFIFSDGFVQSWRWRLCKRMLDILAAAMLVIVAWPIMLVSALLIKWEDGWKAPALYRQTRVGQHGRQYTILKFRSMRVDAEAGKAYWAAEDDSRVTKVGRYLRKYRIDELPQLINVIRGEMSFVGPRPERPEFVDELRTELAFYDIRHRVKPGITGWAQLSYPYGSSLDDAQEKLQYDLYYVKNGSLFLDLVIILGTVEVVLFRKGAR